MVNNTQNPPQLNTLVMNLKSFTRMVSNAGLIEGRKLFNNQTKRDEVKNLLKYLEGVVPQMDFNQLSSVTNLFNVLRFNKYELIIPRQLINSVVDKAKTLLKNEEVQSQLSFDVLSKFVSDMLHFGNMNFGI